MTYQLRASDQPATHRGAALSAPTRFLLRRSLAHFSDPPVAFELVLPDGSVEHVGKGPPSFRISARTARGVRVLGSLDEGRIADAYLAGDIDFDGDMLRLFELKDLLKDRHPLLTAWRFLEPLLFGQVRTDKRVIAAHYDRDAEFFLQFLDPKQPMYTQGVYERDDEPLEAATLRKFDYCYERCRLKPGDRLLEVGPGWGAWLKYAARRGVECTGISISQNSIDYLQGEAKKLGVHWELIYADLLEFKTAVKFDAVVIMGVIEHMPLYDRVLEKCMSVLKPGGRIFIDGVAFTKKYALASYIAKHIYPGNHSYLVLHDLLEKVARTPLQVREIFDDRYSYFLTFRQWARNFDRNRETVVRQFGELDFRRFRLYLWGSTYQFFSRGLGCFRMIIEYPVPEPGR